MNLEYFMINLILCAFILNKITAIQADSPKRQKRHLIFTENMRSYVTCKMKYDIIPGSGRIAHGFGMKIFYPLPTKTLRRYELHFLLKRNVNDLFDKVLRLPGFEGITCIINLLCQNIMNEIDHCGFICQLSNYVMKSSKENNLILNFVQNKCNYYKDECEFHTRESSTMNNF